MYQIFCSMSVSGYKCKPDEEEISRMRFCRNYFSLDRFLHNIRSGHVITNIFSVGDPFKKPTAQLFKGSQLIIYDIDDTELSMREYVAKLKLKPTIVYETNSCTPEQPKFRIIYVFKRLIESGDVLLSLYDHILKLNGLGGDDTHVREVSRIFFGTTQDKDYILNENAIYEVGQFKFDIRPLKYLIPKEINFDLNLVEDFMHNKPIEFYNMYSHFSRNNECSELPVVDADTRMIELPDDFYEITRRFRPSNGRTLKITDGNHRRHTLFNNMLIRRLITPDLTANEMLCNIAYEMDNYILNSSEDVITNEQLRRIVERAMLFDLKEYKYKHPRNRIVNPAYQEKHGGTKKQIAAQACTERHIKKKEEKYKIIDKLYNRQISIAKNLEAINKTLIENFKKENPTITDEKEIAKAKISIATLKRYSANKNK